MAYEVVINCTFTTGSTADLEERAKAGCLELLKRKLEESGLAGEQGLFFFKIDLVEAKKL